MARQRTRAHAARPPRGPRLALAITEPQAYWDYVEHVQMCPSCGMPIKVGRRGAHCPVGVALFQHWERMQAAQRAAAISERRRGPTVGLL